MSPTIRLPTADQSVSAVMAAWERRHALTERDPLKAFALLALAVGSSRCEVHQSHTALVEYLRRNAELALKAAGVDVTSHLDALYPKLGSVRS